MTALRRYNPWAEAPLGRPPKFDHDKMLLMRADDPDRWTVVALAEHFDVTAPAISYIIRTKAPHLRKPRAYNREHPSRVPSFDHAEALRLHVAGVPYKEIAARTKAPSVGAVSSLIHRNRHKRR